MNAQDATGELARFATGVEIGGLEVRGANIALDDRQDGEPVTRITLLVDDPREGEETWRLDAVVDLKRRLSRKAVELGLPSASVTLVPDSESALVASTILARQGRHLHREG
ncbi:MAG TPA: hypothetical protein VMF55_07725 [Solirubrobacterales bacterium]|nr:hypothetical protein [Solirubrobacterales bacterium]